MLESDKRTLREIAAYHRAIAEKAARKIDYVECKNAKRRNRIKAALHGMYADTLERAVAPMDNKTSMNYAPQA